ncbi:MAG: spore germination protein [Clostridia bacterium]|nr:spore germination protein [Clostridia bacterium]
MSNRFEDFRNNVVNAFSGSEDLICRESGANGARFALIFIKGITSRAYISEMILRPLLKTEMTEFDGNFGVIIESPSLRTPENESMAIDSIAKGEVLIITEIKNGFFSTLVNAQEAPSRSIEEPTSDITLRGPKVGFVEDAEKNMALLRRYIRSPDLKFKSFIVGDVSSTKVILAYVSGRADEALVKDISKRINDIKASVITDSANISMLLEGSSSPPLPTCGSTEKADKLASKLMSGRIAIIVDGSPFVLSLPFLFIEGLQASDDYLHTPYYATFIRILRFAAFISAIFAPAILCALISYDYFTMPKELFGLIAESRKDIPLSFFWEIVAILLLFETLREVGVRMPRTVGDAVGIVGSIILGNTAVETGIVSSVGVITVAFSAVCAFITPAYMYVIVIARIVALVLAEVCGIFGLGLGFTVFILLLCGKKSFGTPYMFPLAPFDKKGLQDFIFTFPKKALGRREDLGGRK